MSGEALDGLMLGFAIGGGIGMAFAIPVALWQFAQAWVIEPLRARRPTQPAQHHVHTKGQEGRDA